MRRGAPAYASSMDVQIENSSRSRRIWLNRPAKRNALTPAMIASLTTAIETAGAEPEVPAVVLLARGPVFCAGVDLHEFASGTPDSVLALIRGLRDLCAAARRCPKPVVIGIQGACVGGALELAAACDLRVAVRGAAMSMPEVAVGIPSVIDAILLVQHLGLGRARELILTADPLGAEEAFARGFVNRLVDASEDLSSACEELASRVSRHPASAIATQKQLFEEWLNLPFDEAVERSLHRLAACFQNGHPQRIARARLARSQAPVDAGAEESRQSFP